MSSSVIGAFRPVSVVAGTTSPARSAADMAGEAAAGMPARRAAQAMPSAWLPVEAVTTPSGFPAMVTAASAPRTLNDPVGWKVSSFSSTPSPSLGLGISGVGGSAAATASRARSRLDAQSLAGVAVIAGPGPGR